MPAPYDLTNASNMSGITDVFTSASQLTNGLFGIVVLFLLWFLVFMQLKNYQTKPAVLTASFVTTLASILLFLGNIVSTQVLIVCVVITAIAFALNWGGD
jgi:hypothetical protein